MVDQVTLLLLRAKAVDERYGQAVKETITTHGPYMVSVPGVALLHACPGVGVTQTGHGDAAPRPTREVRPSRERSCGPGVRLGRGGQPLAQESPARPRPDCPRSVPLQAIRLAPDVEARARNPQDGFRDNGHQRIHAGDLDEDPDSP